MDHLAQDARVQEAARVDASDLARAALDQAEQLLQAPAGEYIVDPQRLESGPDAVDGP